MLSQLQLRPDPDVVDTDLGDGELALLNVRTKVYFSLNTTGARIWHHLKQGRTLADISRCLQDEFDVSAMNAEQSVHRLAEELVRNELAEPI